MLDVDFVIRLYSYLSSKQWFSLREATNDGFWRYLSLMVIPNIISSRREDNNDDHFWKKSNRIWPKAIWWYVHLSWDQNPEETHRLLIDQRFNTDIILNLVERSGRKGTLVGICREIMRQYSDLDPNEIIRFKKAGKSGSDSLFRAVMRLNTDRCLVLEPLFHVGGIKGNVKSLIDELTTNK